MIRFILLLLLALHIFALSAQSRLHWRFANAKVVNVEEQSYLEFDVELSSSLDSTYHSSMMVFFSYDPEVFGENIYKSGNIIFTKLELLDLKPEGAEGYTTVQADFSPSVYALTTEAVFQLTKPGFMSKVPLYPAFGGFARFRIKIMNPEKAAGIAFVADTGPTSYTGLMDKNQFYLDPEGKTEVLYGIPEKYSAIYENNLRNIIPESLK